MCTAILGLGPDGTVLLAGVRDEFTDRAWQPPGWHWADRPGVIGGRDLLAGGTWLAVAPAERRVACILNGTGRMAPAGNRRSRGELPLSAAADGKLAPADLPAFDPFRLLLAEPGGAVLLSWDGDQIIQQDLRMGLHFAVNSGLASDLRPGAAGSKPAAQNAPAGDSALAEKIAPAGETAAVQREASAQREEAARAHELARIDHFLPRLNGATLPRPEPGASIPAAWGAWLPLLNGDGIGPEDPRALIVRHDLGDGRIWGTTSISLVSITPEGMRYDFTGAPGDPAAWYPVPLDNG